MVRGGSADAAPGRLTLDDLLARLDKLLASPTGSVAVLLIGVVIRLLSDRTIRRRKPAHHHHPKAVDNA